MKGPVWIVANRPAAREPFFPGLLPAPVEFLSGLLALLRAEGEPALIAVDGSEHDLLLSDAAVKIQLRFSSAYLVALFDEHPGQARLLWETGLDSVIAPRAEWVPELQRLLESRRVIAQTGWIGKSESLRQLAAQVLQAAPAEIAVLVTGESGTGKELVARALHDFSPRARGPFFPVNTGAIPEPLLESELFGHEKGAFTGAVTQKSGIFAAAHGGTVFLDEIGDMPAATQVKLLRVLESRRFRRLGATKELEADVRIVSATNRDLVQLAQSGRFRRDLYYRLSAITLHAVPLRERRADILPLLAHFFRNQSGPAPSHIEPGAVRLLWNYAWPGNVRELRNFADAAAVAAPGKAITLGVVEQYLQRPESQKSTLPVLSTERTFGGEQGMVLHAILHLGQQVRELRRLIEERIPEPVAEQPRAFRPPATSMADAERRAIEAALLETDGNRREAARRLGIGERTLYRKIKDYGLK